MLQKSITLLTEAITH